MEGEKNYSFATADKDAGESTVNEIWCPRKASRCNVYGQRRGQSRRPRRCFFFFCFFFFAFVIMVIAFLCDGARRASPSDMLHLFTGCTQRLVKQIRLQLKCLFLVGGMSDGAGAVITSCDRGPRTNVSAFAAGLLLLSTAQKTTYREKTKVCYNMICCRHQSHCI